MIKTKKLPILLVIPALLFISSATYASYTRSCNASIKIVAKYANKTTVFPFAFWASASSRAYIPNTLRVRAYNRARDCMEMAVYDDYGFPAECNTSSISGYPHRLFGYEGAAAACSDWGLAPGTSIVVKVYGYVWGNKGCGGSRRSRSDTFLIDSNYTVYCR